MAKARRSDDAKSDRQRAINDVAADLPPYWGETRADAPTGFGALEYLKKNKPRVLLGHAG